MAADKQQSQSDALRELQAAFQEAQNQLAQLRKQVEQHSELARVKTQVDFSKNESERVLRELGEAIFKQVQKGRLELPAGFGNLLKAVEQAQQKAEAQVREITDLLQEGEETAQRLKQKSAAGAQSGVAPRTKKL